ncbi:hypothetical protein [Sulfobacillus sp. hq2]|uniref:hypothetical protein n=1 Tax=Sulfobacillus sp. hq2 TaxID=2039167 RepID=UPI0011AF3870|nr:hypothetical protein [Sulfobacillus sp. hq2]
MTIHWKLFFIFPIVVLTTACGVHSASPAPSQFHHHRDTHGHQPSRAKYHHKHQVSVKSPSSTQSPVILSTSSSKSAIPPIVSRPTPQQRTSDKRAILVVAPPPSAPKGSPSAMTVSFDQNAHLIQSANITPSSFDRHADNVTFVPPTHLKPGKYTVIVLFEYANGTFFSSSPKAFVNP